MQSVCALYICFSCAVQNLVFTAASPWKKSVLAPNLYLQPYWVLISNLLLSLMFFHSFFTTQTVLFSVPGEGNALGPRLIKIIFSIAHRNLLVQFDLCPSCFKQHLFCNIHYLLKKKIVFSENITTTRFFAPEFVFQESFRLRPFWVAIRQRPLHPRPGTNFTKLDVLMSKGFFKRSEIYAASFLQRQFNNRMRSVTSFLLFLYRNVFILCKGKLFLSNF